MKIFVLSFGIVVCLAAMCGCSGDVSYDSQPAMDTDSAQANILAGKDGKPVAVAVMPVSYSSSKSAEKSISAIGGDEKFKTEMWDTLKKAVNRSAAMKEAPLPKGKDADAIVEKAMKYAAGLMPAQEFAKAESFKSVDRFLYGAVSVELAENEKLAGGKAVKIIEYRAEAFLRLVDGKTFRYVSSLGKGSDANIKMAILKAIDNAVLGYRLK